MISYGIIGLGRLGGTLAKQSTVVHDHSSSESGGISTAGDGVNVRSSIEGFDVLPDCIPNHRTRWSD